MSSLAGLGTTLRSTDHEFSTLLRFLDSYAHRLGHHSPSCDHFLPRFDVEEHEQTYELYGELAGARRDDVVVEARDSAHVEVRGRIVPSLSSSAASKKPAGSGDQAEQATSATEAAQAPASKSIVTAGVGHGKEAGDGQGEGQGQAPAQTPDPSGRETYVRVQHGPSPTTTAKQQHHHHHQPLDAYEEVLNPLRPSPEPIAAHEPPHDEKPAPTQTQTHVGRLITERHVGEFSRSFHFPTPIKPDEVKAWMENGILRVTVPRAPTKPATKIPIDRVFPEFIF